MTLLPRSRQSNAVVTGAGSGIGRAFAREIAGRGGRVVCADINWETASETAQSIIASGGAALAVKTDVSRIEDIEQMALEAERWLKGPVTLVVNNAGVGVGGQTVGEVSLADWQWTLGINLWGVVHGCHVFVPKLRTLGRGGIINVCSTASFSAAPYMAPYNVSKAAALALSETLSAELAGSGVVVTALCPTGVNTNILQGGRFTANASGLADKVLKRGMSPQRVACEALDALDAGHLYVLPQLDARLIWRIKRLMPDSYRWGAGVLGRFAFKV